MKIFSKTSSSSNKTATDFVCEVLPAFDWFYKILVTLFWTDFQNSRQSQQYRTKDSQKNIQFSQNSSRFVIEKKYISFYWLFEIYGV